MSSEVFHLPASDGFLWQSNGRACQGPVIALISRLCISLKKKSSCLWRDIWLGSGQFFQISVITFRQFKHTDSHLAQILDCFPHLRRRSRAEHYNPTECINEVGRLPD